MNWLDSNEYTEEISDIACRFQEGECMLTWKWPVNIKYVYIYKFAAGNELEADLRPSETMKLFTREEYKARTCYSERIESIGRYGYRVYPCILEDGKIAVIRQEGEENRVFFSTGKAKIHFSISYKNKWFSNQKSARIQFNCEIPVAKETLCYIKKSGSLPMNIEDGIRYPLIDDLVSGRNFFAEIELAKNDYLKLFFTDGKKYGEIYELIVE